MSGDLFTGVAGWQVGHEASSAKRRSSLVSRRSPIRLLEIEARYEIRFTRYATTSDERRFTDSHMNHSSPLDVERLFHAHQHDLVLRLRRMVGCRHAAADLAQDAYLRLLRMGEPQEISHPRAFLYRTAVNLALDYLRKQKHRAPILAPLDDAVAVPSPAPAAMDEVYDKQRFAAFQTALATLPSPTRDVLLLRRLHGCAHGEIAQRLHLTKRQVENHLAKALYHCQRALPDGSKP